MPCTHLAKQLCSERRAGQRTQLHLKRRHLIGTHLKLGALEARLHVFDRERLEDVLMGVAMGLFGPPSVHALVQSVRSLVGRLRVPPHLDSLAC